MSLHFAESTKVSPPVWNDLKTMDLAAKQYG
jgi:hypothetical protein